MKKQILAVVVAGAMFSLPSHAIYNLYKKDGLSFDVNGGVDLYLETDSVKGESGLANLQQEITDERTRLLPEAGASWLDFRASQQLPNDWRATGTLGMGYARGNGSSFLNSANLSFDKLNFGAITFGRQYLHTGFVTRTSTYTPLDVFGDQAIRLDYYGVPRLHTSAYYLFPSSNDVRRTSNSTKTEGFGVSGSYTIPFADGHDLRLAGGYTSNRANPRNLNTTAPKTEGYAVSAEYRFGKLLGAVDYGQQDITLGGNRVAKSDADYLGFKVGYQISPRINLLAGYGTRTHKTTHQASVDANALRAGVLDEIASGGLLASLGSPFLYNELKETRTYVRGDYYLRDNVRLYGQVQKEKMVGEIESAESAKLDDTSYRVGVALSF